MVTIVCRAIHETFEIQLQPTDTLQDLVVAVNQILGNQKPRAFELENRQFESHELHKSLADLNMQSETVTLQIIEAADFRARQLIVAAPIVADSFPHSGEIKSASSTSSTAAMPVSSLSLPYDLVTEIANFFTPDELALQLSLVSKNFLTNNAVSEPEFGRRKIKFNLGIRAKLDKEIAASPDVTLLHRPFLQPGYQNTELKRKLFLQIRKLMLAERLTLGQVIKEIDALLKQTPPPEKLWGIPWQYHLSKDEKKALTQNFTLADFLNPEINEEHLRYAYRVRTLVAVEELKKLKAYQVKSLCLSHYTLDDVKSDWFRPIHAEVERYLPDSTEKQVLMALLEDEKFSEKIAMATDAKLEAKLWRERLLLTPHENKERSFYFRIVSKYQLHYASLFNIMHQVAGLTKPQILELLVSPDPLAGYAPFHYIAKWADKNILTALHGAIQFTKEELRTLMTSVISFGVDEGKTPLRLLIEDLVSKPNKDDPALLFLQVIQDMAQFTSKEWQALLFQHLELGNERVSFLLGVIVAKNDLRLTKLQSIAQLTDEQWKQFIDEDAFLYGAGVSELALPTLGGLCGFNHETLPDYMAAPLPSGKNAGLNLLGMLIINLNLPSRFLAAELDSRLHCLDRGLKHMRKIFSKEKWRELLHTPVEFGQYVGLTPMAMAVKYSKQLLTTIQQTANYSDDEMRVFLEAHESKLALMLTSNLSFWKQSVLDKSPKDTIAEKSAQNQPRHQGPGMRSEE